MKRIDDGFELSTGRVFYAFMGLLCPPEQPPTQYDPVLFYGSDGHVSVPRDDDPDPVEDEPPFTPAERREIADYMIARWNAWAGK